MGLPLALNLHRVLATFFQPCFWKDAAEPCQLDHHGGDGCIQPVVMRATLHCHHISFTAAHISSLIYSFIHVHIHSCVQHMDGCDLCHSVSTRDPRMSSTETLLSVGSQYLGERSTYNLVHLRMHSCPTMHRLPMEHVVSRVE